ncbi:sensor histidine kinase [Cellulomonas carbonis]|uniref:histidine kinase n=1 Tax=Cellulomonas carbonis T26 TaxID=947969 RepID=A0A0A0BUP1_9CELL|nr:ATP-binding protein [Cellulomonas carbonis]KGM12123.1 histidine kinase [Cellulomonas carbonis T26]GGB97202.1 histidine kinase [Cellulomonas carbonis]
MSTTPTHAARTPHRPARTEPGSAASLRGRLRVALLVGGAVLAVVVTVMTVAFGQMSRAQRDITTVFYTAVTQGSASYLALVDAETAVRGYALTGDEVTLEPFVRLLEGDGHQPPDVAGIDVEELLADRFGEDYPPLGTRERAGEAARRWYEDFAGPVIEQVRAEGPGSVSTQEIETGRLMFDDVRVSAEEYLEQIRADRQDAVAEFHGWRDAVAAAMAVLAVAAVVVGSLLWVLLRRWITDPLDRLAADARRVADGDLDHVVVPVGSAEVEQVAADVEAMRSRLALLVAEATAARAEIERSHEQLQGQAEDLRRSNRDLEQFAYVASHDLQEPLRKVASFTQLLAKRYEGQLDERADQYIAFAVDGAKRMQRLINDLLSFSRVGRIGGELSDVDMGAVLDRVTEVLDEVVESTGATVEGVDLPTVRGEEPLLVQLVQNLVVNALKFRHPDRAPHVRITAERVADRWRFACSDNGIGIDPQYAERVFVIFQRLHPKDVYEGTGIGLALCKKIVEYHGGHIWIDTDVTEGTTIRWELPADPTVRGSSAGSESDADDAGSSATPPTQERTDAPAGAYTEARTAPTEASARPAHATTEPVAAGDRKDD